MIKKLLQNRVVLGTIAIVLAIIISFGLAPLFNKSIAKKEMVARVATKIQQGEQITKGMVKMEEIGTYNLDSKVVKDMDDIIGQYARVELHPGDHVLKTKLSNDPLANYEYLMDFNGSMRAISVSIKSFASGLSGKIERGDIVSVLVADYGEERTVLSPVELQYVEVLAVTAGTGLDTEEYGVEESLEMEKELPATITFKVNPQQALLLADMESQGKIHVALVFRGSEEQKNAFLEKQRSAFMKEETENTEPK